MKIGSVIRTEIDGDFIYVRPRWIVALFDNSIRGVWNGEKYRDRIVPKGLDISKIQLYGRYSCGQ